MGAETEAYYRRQNVRQRRSRIPLRIKSVPSTLGPAANLDLPAVRIDAPLADVTVSRENNQGGRIDVFVNGTTRTATGIGAKPTRTVVGNLAAGDLLNLRIVDGFAGSEIIRFYGRDDNEIAWTRINAG